jgi:hypothetical protein
MASGRSAFHMERKKRTELMQNNNGRAKIHLFEALGGVLASLILMFLYNSYLDIWRVPRKNLSGEISFVGWLLILLFAIAALLLRKTLVDLESSANMLDKTRGMEKQLKTIRRKHFTLITSCFGIIAVFSAYQSYFGLWGKNLSTVPMVLTQLGLIQFVALVFVGNLFWRHYTKHEAVLKS